MQERKKKADAKDALADINTPRNAVNYEMEKVTTAGGDDVNYTAASLDMGHDSSAKGKAMTPRPPSGVHVCIYTHTYGVYIRTL
jgi:plastocyanin